MRRNRILRIAGCLCLGVFLYFAATAFADNRFHAAVRDADAFVTKTRDDAFWYNTLSAKEQWLYDALMSAVTDLSEQTESIPFVANETMFRNAVSAYRLDHPAVFYLDAEHTTLITTAHTSKICPTYCALPEARQTQLNDAVLFLTDGIDTTDARNASQQLADRLIDGCTYPGSEMTDTVVGSSAYDALVIGYADGFGYALAYQLLCDSVGIPCETVTGNVNGTPHAWNMLTLDGVVGYTDIMWNDIPMTPETDQATEIPHFYGYTFLSFDEMALDHTADFASLCPRGETETYYEYYGLYAEDAAQLPALFDSLLSNARATGKAEIAFCIGEPVSDSVLQEYLHTAIAKTNETEFDGFVPRLRTVNRVYHASETRYAVTVRLFYEENEEE